MRGARISKASVPDDASRGDGFLINSHHPVRFATDSFRATATITFLPPTFLASLVPKALIGDQRETRWRMMPTASK
jgi:hypothetical protein